MFFSLQTVKLLTFSGFTFLARSPALVHTAQGQRDRQRRVGLRNWVRPRSDPQGRERTPPSCCAEESVGTQRMVMAVHFSRRDGKAKYFLLASVAITPREVTGSFWECSTVVPRKGPATGESPTSHGECAAGQLKLCVSQRRGDHSIYVRPTPGSSVTRR